MSKVLGLCCFLFLFAVPAFAQVQPSPIIPAQWFDNNGKILSGGCLFTYQSGTTTPLGTYSDATGVTPNTNPVILSSSGRATVFLQAQAYTLTLKSAGGSNCSSGTVIYSIDGINPSANSILSSNNTWTGTNDFTAATTFDGSVTFNAGFTSLGPNVLGGGGSMSGTFSGSPTFSGTPNFSAGFTATTGTFSGQITSTLATGTAPFVIASTTKSANLNADLLDGTDWVAPGPIGGTTPSSAVFTTLFANTSLTINGGTAQTATQGTDTHLMTAGTVSGTGATLCTDANGGATTTGCFTGVTRISTGSLGTTSCTTGSSTYDTCTSVITITPTQADTNYVPACTGLAPSDPRAMIQTAAATSTTSITATVVTEGSVAINFGNIKCSAIHP